MSRIITVLGLVIALAALAGCRQSAQPTPTPSSAVQIEFAVEPEPATTGGAVLIITVTDETGEPVEGAQVAARGDMNHAGMRPVFGESTQGEQGVYWVPFEWTMGGDWFVDVTVTLPNGEALTRRFELTVRSS